MLTQNQSMSARKLNDFEKSYGSFYVITKIISFTVSKEIVVVITFNSPSVSFVKLSIFIYELFESFLGFLFCGICLCVILQYVAPPYTVYFYNEYFHNL